MLPILNQSFWRDEAFSALLSEKSPLEIIRLTAKDASPPLYMLLLHYWMILFGNNEVVLRSFSLLFHVLLVGVCFLLIRKLTKSISVALLGSVAILLNPFLLEYAFEARMYSMLAFLTILAVYLLSLRKTFPASIVLALGILTHNFGVFNFFAVGIWWILSNKTKLKTKSTLDFFAFPFFSILIWGSVIWNQWVKVGQGFWIKPVTSDAFLRTLETFSKGDLLFSSSQLLFTLTLILLFFAFSYWVNKNQTEETQIPSLLVSVAFTPIIIVYAVSTFFSPIYTERYLIACLPALICLVIFSLYQKYLINTKVRNFLIGCMAIYFVLLLQGSEKILSTYSKPAINYGVKQAVLNADPKNDIIIPTEFLNFLEVKYYVLQSKTQTPVFVYLPEGKATIPFYIGKILFEDSDVITSLPKNKRIWEISSNGGHTLLKSSGKK